MPPQTFRGQVIVRKSSYVRYYAEHRRNLCYHVLKTPKRQYTLWFNTPDGERGYDCTKAEFVRFNVPDSTVPERECDLTLWAENLKSQERTAVSYGW